MSVNAFSGLPQKVALRGGPLTEQGVLFVGKRCEAIFRVHLASLAVAKLGGHERGSAGKRARVYFAPLPALHRQPLRAHPRHGGMQRPASAHSRYDPTAKVSGGRSHSGPRLVVPTTLAQLPPSLLETMRRSEFCRRAHHYQGDGHSLGAIMPRSTSPQRQPLCSRLFYIRLETAHGIEVGELLANAVALPGISPKPRQVAEQVSNDHR